MLEKKHKELKFDNGAYFANLVINKWMPDMDSPDKKIMKEKYVQEEGDHEQVDFTVRPDHIEAEMNMR